MTFQFSRPIGGLLFVCLCCFAMTLLSGCGGGGSSAEAVPTLTPAEQAYADKIFAEHGKDALLRCLGDGDFPEPDIPDMEDISTARRVWRDAMLRGCKYLASKGADVNAKEDEDGWSEGFTPLHYAAQHGNLELVKFLVSKGANVNAKDKRGDTPLDYARGMAEQCQAHEDEDYRYFKEVADYLSGLK